MSETVANTVREEIDDKILDPLEDKIEQIKNPLVRGAAQSAVGTLRLILQIPDDIGGDED